MRFYERKPWETILEHNLPLYYQLQMVHATSLAKILNWEAPLYREFQFQNYSHLIKSDVTALIVSPALILPKNLTFK